jgi:hypothetical protein
MYNGWWSKGDGYNPSPGSDEMPTTPNRVPQANAANCMCADSAIPRYLPRHSP